MRLGVCATASLPESHAPGPGMRVRMVRRWLPAGGREAPHSHGFIELCHVESGRGQLLLGARTAVAPAHSVTVVPQGSTHALSADTGWTCGANLLHFEATALPPGPAAAAVQGLCRLAAAGHGSVTLRGAAGQAVGAGLAHIALLPPESEEERREALGETCQRLLRCLRDARVAEPVTGRGEASSPGSRPEIGSVLAYIEQNLTRPISRQDLARQAAFAPSYFSALFREATGTTIPEYLNARRVVRAQELLRDPETRVSAVCYAVGFRDLSNFNRVFKRLVGSTPREYRRAVLGDGYEEEAEESEEAARA